MKLGACGEGLWVDKVAEGEKGERESGGKWGKGRAEEGGGEEGSC